MLLSVSFFFPAAGVAPNTVHKRIGSSRFTTCEKIAGFHTNSVAAKQTFAATFLCRQQKVSPGLSGFLKDARCSGGGKTMCSLHIAA